MPLSVIFTHITLVICAGNPYENTDALPAMTLAALRGSRRIVNTKLLHHAIDHAPSLIIDCANCANPHEIFPYTTMERFAQVYVIVAEAIYRFRDTLLVAADRLEQLEANTLIITTFDRLFTYDDDLELHNITEHAWEIIQHLAETYDVLVGITRKQIAPKEVNTWDIRHGASESLST